MRCRRVASLCLKSPGALEACCGRRDVALKEVWGCAAGVASLPQELGRRAAGPGMWMCRSIELWSCAAGVGSWTCRGLEVWRCATGV